MHQHVRAHDGYIFFFQNTAAFGFVCQNNLDFLRSLLVAVGRSSLAPAEYSAAALIGHSYGGEEGTSVASTGDGTQGKAGFFIHFPDGGLFHILSWFHKPGWKFIDESSGGIAVLSDQHHLVLIQAVYHHPVRRILLGYGLQSAGIGVPGDHIIGRNTPIPVNSFQFIVTQEPAANLFLDFSDTAHDVASGFK